MTLRMLKNPIAHEQNPVLVSNAKFLEVSQTTQVGGELTILMPLPEGHFGSQQSVFGL